MGTKPKELAELLDELVAFIRRFVVMTDAQLAAAALWVAHTYAFRAAAATPYLNITSAEPESGKTTLLETFEFVVARPWFTSRATTAALTRKIAAEKPTLLYDESDTSFKGNQEFAEALRGVLNSGYRDGGKWTVCNPNGGKSWTYEDLSTYCPKAIAGIGNLPDTVVSRSITIELKRRRRDEEIAPRGRRRDVVELAAPVRTGLVEWTTDDVIELLAAARPEIPIELGDRAGDVWEPLLAIADMAGGNWPERARSAALDLSAGAKREHLSIGVHLLADCRRAFDANGDRISSRGLCDALAADPERPWASWHRDGKPLSERALADLLRPYGIASKSVWIADEKRTSRGYKREHFEDAWARYLADHLTGPTGPSADAGLGPVTDPTGGTGPNGSRQAANPHEQTILTDLSDETGLEGPEAEFAAALEAEFDGSQWLDGEAA